MTLVLQALLAAGLAGVVAVLVTVAIERFGGILGGFLGTLPSTIVPASAGLWASLDSTAFRDALCVVPAGMLLNASFLWLWRVLPPRLPASSLGVRLALMVSASLAAWSVAAVALVTATRWATAQGVPAALLGLGATVALVGLGVAVCWRGVPAPKGKYPVGPWVLLARGVFAAAAIGGAIAIADLGSPLLAGVASVFPAIFLTAMVSLWWSQGTAVSAGAVGPMMLGSTSVAVYALGAAFTFDLVGPLPGSVASWLVAALGVTVPATLWLRSW